MKRSTFTLIYALALVTLAVLASTVWDESCRSVGDVRTGAMVCDTSFWTTGVRRLLGILIWVGILGAIYGVVDAIQRHIRRGRTRVS